jgi:hypothetical protein
MSRPRTLRKNSDVLNPSIESTGIDKISSEIDDESESAFTSDVAGVSRTARGTTMKSDGPIPRLIILQRKKLICASGRQQSEVQ